MIKWVKLLGNPRLTQLVMTFLNVVAPKGAVLFSEEDMRFTSLQASWRAF